jgi:hypothetical protein
MSIGRGEPQISSCAENSFDRVKIYRPGEKPVERIVLALDDRQHLIRVDAIGSQRPENFSSERRRAGNDLCARLMVIDTKRFLEYGLQRMGKGRMTYVVKERARKNQPAAAFVETFEIGIMEGEARDTETVLKTGVASV